MISEEDRRTDSGRKVKNMAESLLKEEIEVYSEKYDIHGTVRDYGMVTKLFLRMRVRKSLWVFTEIS